MVLVVLVVLAGLVSTTLAAALVQVLLGFGGPDWDVVADLEAGPTTPFEHYHAFAHDTLVVVGPSWRSPMTARRLMPMVAGQKPLVVANASATSPTTRGSTWPPVSPMTRTWPRPSAWAPVLSPYWGQNGK